MRMLADIQTVRAELPGLDCGACGAPSCRAFAEDVVRGTAERSACVLTVREQLQQYLREQAEEEASV